MWGRGRAITLSSVSTITHCYISPASGEIYAASADLGEKMNIVWGGRSSARTSGPRKCVALSKDPEYAFSALKYHNEQLDSLNRLIWAHVLLLITEPAYLQQQHQ